VGAFSILICFVVYILTGLFGYIGFRDAVQCTLLRANFIAPRDVPVFSLDVLLLRCAGAADLLDTYDVTHILVPDVIVRIVQCGIGIALIFSFPVLAFELRHCVDAVFFPHAEFRCVDPRAWCAVSGRRRCTSCVVVPAAGSVSVCSLGLTCPVPCTLPSPAPLIATAGFDTASRTLPSSRFR